MHKGKVYGILGSVWTLALTLAVAASAAPPTGFQEAVIGEPDEPGSMTVDADGVWEITSSGNQFDGQTEDQLYYVYQAIQGNASIRARLIEQAEPGRQYVGPMVRASTDANSPFAGSIMSTSAVNWITRAAPDTNAIRQSGAGTSFTFPQNFRLQRVGNSVAGYTSTDGKVWRPVAQPTQLPLGETALIGLAVSSRESFATTALFDQVSVQAGAALVHGVKACGADKSVVMEWNAIEGAESYNIYRAAAGETDITKYVKVTDQVIAGTTYTDASAGLENGTTVDYQIAPVVNGVEGDRVVFSATPDVFTIALPPGFAGLSTNEGVDCGTGAAFNPDTGEIILRGSGGDIWDSADRYNFTHQEVEGNFQITVKALTKPTHTHDWSKAGLMIRESLAPGSRNAYFVLTAINGLTFQYREETDTGAAGNIVAIANDELEPPIMIRMTRDGDLITGEYSLDDGATWEYGGEIELPDLAAKVQTGLAITSHNSGVISEARFQNLQVTKP